MKVEIVERRKFHKGAQRVFWEIYVDDKLAEVTLFDPTKAIQEVCEEIQRQGGSFTREDVKMETGSAKEEQL